MKTFRIWQSDGKPIEIKCESLTFKKEKGGLKIMPKGHKTIKGAVCIAEITAPEVVEIPKNVRDDDDAEEV